MEASYDLRVELRVAHVPVGRLAVGLRRHRALLFKVAAERVGGAEPTGSREVLLRRRRRRRERRRRGRDGVFRGRDARTGDALLARRSVVRRAAPAVRAKAIGAVTPRERGEGYHGCGGGGGGCREGCREGCRGCRWARADGQRGRASDARRASVVDAGAGANDAGGSVPADGNVPRASRAIRARRVGTLGTHGTHVGGDFDATPRADPHTGEPPRGEDDEEATCRTSCPT